MNEIALVWVEQYPSSQASLDYSQEAATGFATELPGTVVFQRCDFDAFDQLFEGLDPLVETGQILYYAGHGTREGPLFEVNNKDDGVARPDNMRLGRRLVMAVFDSCKALEDKDRWRQVFAGLRYVVGFAATVGECPIRGARFAQLLREGSTVTTAWEKAATETEGEYAPWRVLSSTDLEGKAIDEPWPDAGTPIGEPHKPSAFVCRTEVLENLLPQAGGSDPTTVDFFRLVPADTEDLIRRSAAPVDLLSSEHRQTPAGPMLKAAGGTLEIFSASGSFRWLRKTQSSRALFEEQELVPLPPREAVRAANRFLERLGFLDDRVSLGSVTSTHEVHETRNGERRMNQVVARHVQYAYSLAGLPVFGPGAKMRVTFESSEVDGFLRFWREPVREGSVGVITPEIAEKSLRESRAFRHLPATSIEIHSRKLGYLAFPPTQPQNYLLPVYAIAGAVVTSAMRYDFVRYVPAASEEGDPGTN